jgi:hypothetical protein
LRHGFLCYVEGVSCIRDKEGISLPGGVESGLEFAKGSFHTCERAYGELEGLEEFGKRRKNGRECTVARNLEDDAAHRNWADAIVWLLDSNKP